MGPNMKNKVVVSLHKKSYEYFFYQQIWKETNM
jgi:hypothetical protein